MMLKLNLFGHFYAAFDNEPLHLPAKSVAALAAYLVLEQRVPQPRAHLSALLWPDSSEVHGRRNLRQTLLRLHQTFPDTSEGQSPILVVHDTLQWNPAYPLAVDIQHFEAQMSAADPFLHTPIDQTPYIAIPHLQTALDVYTADLLLGFDLYNDLYADWLLPWRVRYQRQALTALARLADYYGRAGLLPRMEAMARRQLTLDLAREEAHAQLLQAYLAQGEYSAALSHYAVYEKQLQETGIQPAAGLQALHQEATALRLGNPTPAQPIPSNLPPEETPFHGRQDELDDLLLWLVAPDRRLLTLRGLGGMGKTRLALQVARHFTQMRISIPPRFPGGVWFVPLAELQPDEDSAEAVADVILQSCAWQTKPNEKPLAAVRRYLQADACLLLLDNLEHLPGMTHFVMNLLADIPTLTVLTTSRQELGLQQEVIRQLHGLSTPEIEGDLTASSLVLLIERMQRLSHSFEPTAPVVEQLTRICRALDGWPLALELAASWSARLPIPEIADRIAANITALQTSMPDLPARHRSMEAALVGSYNLLTPAQQQVLARFSVLQAGCTAEAAGAILAASTEDMAALVNLALIQKKGQRYRIHELIRQFGATKLAEMGETAQTERAHGQYYLNLIISLGRELHGPHPIEAIRQLRPERSNIHKAWIWALKNEQYELLQTALPAIIRFYKMTGLLSEGQAMLNESLPALPQSEFALSLRFFQVSLFMRQGDYDLARNALAIFPRLSSLSASHQLEFHLCSGKLSILNGKMAESRHYYQHALVLARRLNHQDGIVLSLTELGILHDYEESYRAELLNVLDGLEDIWLQRAVYSFLGSMSIRHSQYQETYEYWQKALAISLEMEDWYAVASFHNNLGDALRELGEFDKAEQAFQQAIALDQSLKNDSMRMNTLEGWARLCILREHYEQARLLAEDAVDLAITYSRPTVQQTALCCLGHAHAGMQNWENASNAYASAAILVPDSPHLAMEAIAGLAYARWRQGNEASARTHINQFLDLQAQASIEGCYSPQLSYQRAAEVLRELGEAQKADAVLAKYL
jgi:DNA-binding SARP family transcriptional activator/predicted ATPase/Flp pilus assembly protein TadD